MGDRLATVDMGQKLGRAVRPVPLMGEAASPCNTLWPGRGLPLYRVVSWSVQPFDHNKHGPKIGGLCPLWGRGTASSCSTVWPGLRPTSIPCGILMATVDTGRKLGGSAPFARGAGSPSNTVSLGLRPTSLPSGILIHPAIWPQQIWSENWGGCVPLGEGSRVPT